jgi:Tol biopolymer transport system component
VRKKLVAVFVVLLLAVASIFLLIYKDRSKALLKSIRWGKGGSAVSYIMPCFSTDSKALAFVRVEKEMGKGGINNKALIVYSDIRGVRKKKVHEASLGAFNEVFIRQFSVDGNNMVIEKVDFKNMLGTRYRCDLNTGQCSIQGEHSLVMQGESIVPSGDGSRSAIVFTPPGDRGTAKIEIQDQSGGRVTIMDTPLAGECFTDPLWVNEGKALLFQFHRYVATLYRSELMLYSPGATRPVKLADDCTSVLPAPRGGIVAYLVPLNRGREKDVHDEDSLGRWEMITKNIGAQGDMVPFQQSYTEDIDLYSWSPDGRGILFQKGKLLCFLDLKKGEEHEVMSAERDGWWGYPLSPYNIAWSPDGQKIAVLAYMVSADGRSLMERVLDVDVESGAKKVIHSQSLLKGRFGLHWSFHQRIVWSPSGEFVAWEGRREKSPEDADILMIRLSDGERKKLSKGFLGLFNL